MIEPRQKSCSCPKGGIKTLPLPISHEQSPGDVWLCYSFYCEIHSSWRLYSRKSLNPCDFTDELLALLNREHERSIKDHRVV
jgi:hypothetical protein